MKWHKWTLRYTPTFWIFVLEDEKCVAQENFEAIKKKKIKLNDPVDLHTKENKDVLSLCSQNSEKWRQISVTWSLYALEIQPKLIKVQYEFPKGSVFVKSQSKKKKQTEIELILKASFSTKIKAIKYGVALA